MRKISSPVLFDANILINFKGQLKFLFSFFENVIIHRKVFNEIVGQALKDELISVSNVSNIIYVEDNFPTDEVGKKLLEECDKELKDSFNIEDLKDLGEYKTLLYAKFNNVFILSSQDTTVWRFVTESKYFKGLKCITVQDFAYLLFLNAENKSDRKIARNLYKAFAREEHPFECFKIFMERNDNEIPVFIEFENNRISNFQQLVQGYFNYYVDTSYCESKEVEYEISNLASNNTGNCLSCIYSRIDKNNVDYSIRKCLFDYSLNDEQCSEIREGFSMRIRNRIKE
ncbi:hypothetical protein [Proteiniborus sp. MB09-C3]|uniref:hypothetical protein n=1 Tax=Proteiniborus sp. MB09-C3 TaxID=3050072 RepID=UPI0025567FE5|nr:hypothetical protein [Proteiniborus sp. MB09-C3]WIV13244.1 hypothetical protein QO263_05915 [Proteiniborus sp. MB09-C3]